MIDATLTSRVPLRQLRSKRLLALAGEERLVEQVRRGNQLAFEIVFERHGAGILSFCRHMLGSREDAEDAVQHTFAAAYSDLQRASGRTIALKAWLYTIARNRCISVLRARREQAAELHELPTEGLSEKVEQRAELRELLSDVRELPEEQRAALLLAEAAGLSHSEVAEVLGCEVARVKALVFRARSSLIERRSARETSCDDVREQLATLRGGALRRNELRHHLRRCPGCSAYREEVRRQRQLLASALPVVPSLGPAARWAARRPEASRSAPRPSRRSRSWACWPEAPSWPARSRSIAPRRATVRCSSRPPGSVALHPHRCTRSAGRRVVPTASA
jgi:RNA polymerase sigma factor (sigma-70 family)